MVTCLEVGAIQKKTGWTGDAYLGTISGLHCRVHDPSKNHACFFHFVPGIVDGC